MSFDLENARFQLVRNISDNVYWGDWDLASKTLLALCLRPVLDIDESEKRTTELQWLSIRLNRHLFNIRSAILPRFMVGFISKTDTDHIIGHVGEDDIKDTVLLILKKSEPRKKIRGAVS